MGRRGHKTRDTHHPDALIVSRHAVVTDLAGKVLAQSSYTAGELTSAIYPSGTGNAGNGTNGTWTRNPAGVINSVHLEGRHRSDRCR